MVNWVCTDNYRLAFIGIDVDDMAEALEALIEEAEEVTGTMQVAIATELEAITCRTVLLHPLKKIWGCRRRLSAVVMLQASLQHALDEAIESTTDKVAVYQEADSYHQCSYCIRTGCL